MNILKKIITGLTIGVVLITFAFSVHYQIKFEKYIVNQKEKYNILIERERLSYKPVIIYLIDRKNYMKAGGIVYSNCKQKSIFAGRLYDGYIVNCYYRNEEIKSYLYNNYKVHDLIKGLEK